MEILIRRSAWRDAVQYYQMFYSRLLRDVGAEPSPELQELSKQFRLQKTRDVEENVLHLEVCTIPSLPGGWMSQVLKALCQSNQITWSDHLTQRQLSDLAYLQPILPAQTPTCVPMVRVAEAFIDLITGLCTGNRPAGWRFAPERRPLGCAKPGCGRGSAEEMQPQAGDPVTEILCRPCGFAAR